jgi:ABC-type Fe3+-hydroxamate transport system substrate-binding protein
MQLIRIGSLVLLGLALAGTHSGRSSAQEPDTFPRTVTDPSGRRVTVDVPPRVIALIGDAPEVRAVVEPAALRHSDPLADPRAFDWSDVGLLVLSDLYAAINPAWLDEAEARGIPVFLLSETASLDDWRATIEALGQATGREDRSAAALTRLENRLKRLAVRVASRPIRRTLVLSPEGYTFGRDTLIGDLLNSVAARNVAAEAGFDDYRQIDTATIRELAPDAILLSPTWTSEQIAQFRADPALSDVPAFQRGQIFRLPFSPTLPDDPAAAAFALALLLHPAALLH